MMRFRYIGPEDQVTIFGATFVRDGEAVQIEDSHAIAKLCHHREFEAADQEAEATVMSYDIQEAAQQPRRRGRPRKVRDGDAD